MTFTAVGVAIPVLGQARKVTLTQGRDRPELQRNYFSIDPTMLRTAQPDRIRVDWDHTSTILGDVVSLQLRGGQLWAAAELDGPAAHPDAPPVYWSVASSKRATAPTSRSTASPSPTCRRWSAHARSDSCPARSPALRPQPMDAARARARDRRARRRRRHPPT